MSDFTELLREARGSLSQQRTASDLQIARSNISEYENGSRIPLLKTLKKLLTYYGVPDEQQTQAIKEWDKLPHRGKKLNS